MNTKMKYIKLSICFCMMLPIVTGCNHSGKKVDPVTGTPKETVEAKNDSVSEETAYPVETDDVEVLEEDNISPKEWRYEDEKNGCYAEWKYDEQTKCLTICGTGGTHDEEETFNDEYEFDGPFFDEFENRDEVREVIIEKGITKINRAAFASFTNLERVSIPDSVKKIGDYVFYECTGRGGVSY